MGVELTRAWVEMHEIHCEAMGSENALKQASLCRYWLASQWQPIETAPKDGDCFLGVDAAGAYSVCVFYKDRFESADDGTDRLELTHWQLLPDPPNDL